MTVTRKASTKEIIEINNLLTKHLHKMEAVDGDGNRLYKYEEGWDDTRIAVCVSNELSKTHVGRVRREMFGSLLADKADPKEVRLSMLERRHRALEKFVYVFAQSLGHPLPNEESDVTHNSGEVKRKDQDHE